MCVVFVLNIHHMYKNYSKLLTKINSFQIDKDWRVVTTFADKTYPKSTDNILESKPRPLEFDERLHKSMNSEFKYLYTAITRAKCNLWIYDSSESRRLPMLDYWMRCGLVRVVRVGEKEEDDRVLFTATSTPEQWRTQGDYFRKKGLWEPAIKCYHKAGDTLSEKEAEAYLFAQKARHSKIPREIQEWFEKAALAFLTCDYKSHDVKYLVNAAKCLKNARKHAEAAKLFERLGQVSYIIYSTKLLTSIMYMLLILVLKVVYQFIYRVYEQ